MRAYIALVLVALVACDRDGSGGERSARPDNDGEPERSAAPSTTAAEAASTASGAAEEAPPRADPSRLELEGEAVQGGLLFAKVEEGTREVTFPGHRVVISPEGEFLIGFYRNAPAEETLEIVFPDGAVLEKVFEVKQREYEVDRIDGLPERFVKLGPKRKRQLAAANARIAKARNTYTKKPHYRDGFAWPVEGEITSRYGQKRILNGTDGGIHWGVDVAVPVGTTVKAPCDGTVIFVEKNVPLAGHTLIIDHGHGLTSTLIHLAGFTKEVGDEVEKGDVVGTVGMTGRTTGPHLDWRMNLFEHYRLDPELLVPPMD